MPTSSGWGAEAWEIRVKTGGVEIASHLSVDGKFDEVLLVDVQPGQKTKMVLSSVWLTKEGKAVNREVLGEKEVELKTGVVELGNAKLNINVFRTAE